MKKFFYSLLSDSNKVSSKRFIGLISVIMFLSYGIRGLIIPFNLQFSVFYISLCIITIWVSFKFMSAEKILKYNILGQLSNFGKVKDGINSIVQNEEVLDDVVQPIEEEKNIN